MKADANICLFNNVLGIEFKVYDLQTYDKLNDFTALMIPRDWTKKWENSWPKRFCLYKKQQNIILGREIQSVDKITYLKNENFPFLNISSSNCLKHVFNLFLNEQNTFDTLLKL